MAKKTTTQKTFEKIKTQTLISLLYHGANQIGYELAKTLSDQGNKVIVLDTFDKFTKPYVKKLKSLKDVDFVDQEGSQGLFDNIKRIDYVFYLFNNYISSRDSLDSKEFLTESNRLSEVLNAAVKYDAKFSLVSTVYLHQKYSQLLSSTSYIKPEGYSKHELQKYVETVTAEYHDKNNLNARIVRIGEVLGEGFLPLQDDELLDILKSSVKGNSINIRGEGLKTHYVIDVEDAVYGLVKLTFDRKVAGEVITLANNHDYTSLSIAYKLLELDIDARNIKFEEGDKHEVLYSQYVPAPNATEYGWSQKVPLELMLGNLMSFLYKENNKAWKFNQSEHYDFDQELEKYRKRQKDLSDKQVPLSQAKPIIVRTKFGEIVYAISSPFGKIFGWFSNTSSRLTGFVRSLSILRVSAIAILLGVIFYFLIAPMLVGLVSGTVVYFNLKNAQTSIANLEFDDATTQISRSENHLSNINWSVSQLGWLANITGQEDLHFELNNLVYAAEQIAGGGNQMLDWVSPLQEYVKAFDVAGLGVQTTQTREYTQELQELDSTSGEILLALRDINEGSAIIESTDTEAFPGFVQKYIVDMKNFNSNTIEQVDPISKMLIYLPQLLGLEERQRYLVLFQNPTELRSSGGWLSSYGIISIERGRVRGGIEVGDVYNIDGLLLPSNNNGETQVPPADMGDALAINNWTFSLANWDPEFSDVALDAEKLLVESGKVGSVDGVIAVDVTFLQLLLNKWGGVEVNGELIDQDNIYTKIFEIHNEFTPGSSLKSDFTKELVQVVMNRFFSLNINDLQDLSEVMSQSLDQKHILLNLKNSQAQEFIISKGWDGNISKKSLATPAIVEWNWGANKANFFLDRVHTLNLDIVGPQEINYSYRLDLKNNSVSNTYPEGDYVNYLRLYLPLNAQIQTVTGFEEGRYSTNKLTDRLEIAGWFNVPAGQGNQLDIQYKLDNQSSYLPFSSNDNFGELDLRMFKQPGTNEDKLNLTITHPEFWSITDNQELTVNGNKLEGTLDLKTDLTKVIKWEF